MFSSQLHITRIDEVPSHWILEHYLEFPFKVTGQSIKIRSLFNVADKDPSMVIYFNTNLNKYTFKDFSSGRSGSVTDIMMQIWKCSFPEAMKRIINDYKAYLDSGRTPTQELEVEETMWVPTNVQTRKWNTDDAKYWTAYNIGSKLLQEYNVKPLKSYSLNKATIDGDIIESFTIGPNAYMYGFFKDNGELYKVYRPKAKKGKFMTFDTHYLQGREQCRHIVNDTIIITSSLKDGMALKSLNLRVDIIAPNSETTFLSPGRIRELKVTYKHVIVLFDNDEAGIRAMKYYRDELRVPICYVPFEKDLARTIKVRGAEDCRFTILPRIHDAMEKYDVLNPEPDEEREAVLWAYQNEPDENHYDDPDYEYEISKYYG